MNVSFANGSAEQQALVNQVIADSAFPWSSIAVNVTVEWTARPDLPQQHNLFALTTGPQPDGSYLIELRQDLGDSRYGTNLNGQPGGADRDLFYDVFHHELGHVMQGVANSATAIAPLFHGSVDRWNKPANVWAAMIKEGDAETFKDVFSRRRKWNNRSGWQLPRDNYAQWAAVYMPGSNWELALTWDGDQEIQAPTTPPAVPPGQYSGEVSHAFGQSPVSILESDHPRATQFRLVFDFSLDAGSPWRWGDADVDAYFGLSNGPNPPTGPYRAPIAGGPPHSLSPYFWNSGIWGGVTLGFSPIVYRWDVYNQVDVGSGIDTTSIPGWIVSWQSSPKLDITMDLPVGWGSAGLNKVLFLPTDGAHNFANDPVRRVYLYLNDGGGGGALPPWPYLTGRTLVTPTTGGTHQAEQAMAGGGAAPTVIQGI